MIEAIAATQRTGVRVDLAALAGVERRVLWLASAMVDHANRGRPNRSGIKVGGHQASSASMVTIMTSLWLGSLDATDRVSVKPHASPVLHALNYVLGRLEPRYLETLRQYGGLQSYPSRSKDPDPVDYSTGSVGIGATATIWGALAHRYVAGQDGPPPRGRQIALLGDAELDEGACWEAIADPMVRHLGELLWVVDVNRQSLDRVVPEISASRLRGAFEAMGWHAITIKYGRRLEELFGRRGGSDLRRRLDLMGNEEYQRLLRSDGPEARNRLAGSGAGRRAIARLVSELDDDDLVASIRDLGGHDASALLDAYEAAAAVTDRPSVIFAYTIKGWSLPTQGHPANHSALLTAEQMQTLAERLDADASDPWAQLPEGSPEADLCQRAAARLLRPPVASTAPPDVPLELGRRHTGTSSTQQALGRFFVDLVNKAPEVATRVVTVSPDVASSTNLGGWINKVGIWNLADRADWFADDTDTLVHWRESARGQHIELGIAEMNLVGLLGELGATWSRYGQPLLPVGTIYDPFVTRAHEPWSFGIYAGGRSILVGTPSGVTLGPEGGAHQSVLTPSVGLEQPDCIAWEPAFAQDVEWCFLDALGRLGRADGSSSYLRLSTRPIDQSLAAVPDESETREARRRDVVGGGYVLRDDADARVTLVAVGSVVPEALDAATSLRRDAQVPSRIVCLTSPDLIFRALRARQGLAEGDWSILDRLFPSTSRLPMITVQDGHPHTLAFLGAVQEVAVVSLGVTQFGQSGDILDLYRHHGLDAETIVDVALDVIA